MYSVSLVCLVMYWKIGQFYKDSETGGYKGIYYYIIFSIPPDTTRVRGAPDNVKYWHREHLFLVS